MDDPAVKLKYNKSKLKLKLWESDFKQKTGNNPSKDDIKEAPAEIRDAYKWYWQIKIHALGQDSMLDATFEDKKQYECTSTPSHSEGVQRDDRCNGLEAEAYSSPESVQCATHSTAEKELSSIGKQENCDPLNTSINKSSQVSPVGTLFAKESPIPMKFKEKLSQEDGITMPASESVPISVWGTHLNKDKKEDGKPKETKFNRSSSSFQLSEKLFVGSKFKKRNPRKSMSFSGGRGKEKSSLTVSDSLLAPPASSFSVDSSQGLDDGFPVSDLESKINSQSSNRPQNHEFVMIKRNMASNMQPLSAVQKMMEEDSKPSKPKVERTLDRGWLERVMQADQILSQEAREHMTQSVVESPQPEGRACQPIFSEDSDDDIVYGSDNESKSPHKVEKEEKARLALRPTALKEPTTPSLVQNSENNFKATHLPEKSETNVKKRKLDAVEAAMVVLSERCKNDKSFLKPNKKHKTSVDPEQGTRNESVNLFDENLSEIEMNENSKGSEISCPKPTAKSGMSKKEVLEKKVSSGSINDNFVRINMKKKVFVRGKKTMNFQKYKKQQWKNKKKELSDQASAYLSRLDPGDSAAGGGLQKCFKCGEVGHYARQCTKMKGDSLMPYGAEDEEEESPFPSLAEVEKMAKEKKEFLHYRIRNYNKEKIYPVTNENEESSNGQPGSCIQIIDEAETSVDIEQEFDESSILKEPVNSERKFGLVEPLYPLSSNGSLIDTPPEVYECLRRFGHESFRPGQEVAIMRILSGLSTLVTLSTGSGKSLCYQLPAYLYALKKKCITLVVSPLVSLMDDQISDLPSFINGAALHTGQTEKQREKVMEMAKSGKLQFLLVSPEAVVAGERKSGFGSLLRELPNIAFACIDEAHCVSQWSHNFRPSYLVIFKVLREKLGVQTVLGLTATATQAAITSIIEHMQIPDGRRGVIKDVPLPNNLLLTVSRDSNRDQALIKLLSSLEFKEYRSIIVYCTRREECERLAALLRTCLKVCTNVTTGKRKVSTVSEAYHAGLSSARRKQVQTAFMSGNIRIVVATVAFGMGINKSDIRSVVHFNMPCNFESYVQEVGRAGRDGLVSHCHLFLNNEGRDLNELRRHIFADSVDRHSVRKLLQRVFVPCKCSAKNSRSPNESTSSNHPKKQLEESKDHLDAEKNCESPACVGHEVAFSVEETVAALDLPEENITTLLCYLELHDKNLLQVMPKAYTHCRVLSYKGMKQIKEVARSCPPLAMAIALDLMTGSSQETSNQIEFPVVEIASAIGWDSGIVKKELMNLEWTKVNGNSRRSGIKIEFSNLGFRVRAPGNLSPEKLDSALDFLHDRVAKQERNALSQLQTIFSAVTSVSLSSVGTMMEAFESELETHSNNLKTIVRAYFQEHALITPSVKSEEKLENGDQIANDTRQLVSMYRDCTFTGRAIARIFHGISSPNFPSQVWGRCRFWRAHLESDFKLICLLATRVLLKMR